MNLLDQGKINKEIRVDASLVILYYSSPSGSLGYLKFYHPDFALIGRNPTVLHPVRHLSEEFKVSYGISLLDVHNFDLFVNNFTEVVTWCLLEIFCFNLYRLVKFNLSLLYQIEAGDLLIFLVEKISVAVFSFDSEVVDHVLEQVLLEKRKNRNLLKIDKLLLLYFPLVFPDNQIVRELRDGYQKAVRFSKHGCRSKQLIIKFNKNSD